MKTPALAPSASTAWPTRVIVATMIASGVAACSLVYTSELDDARESAPAATLDGASPSADAASEAGTAQNDATSDSPVALVGCAAYQPTPKYCRDFDSETALPVEELDRDPGTSNQIVTLDTAQSYSGPRSLLVRMENVSDGCNYTRLSKAFDNVGAKRFSLHVRMRPTAPRLDHAPLVLAVENATGYCALILYLNNGGRGINAQFGDPSQNDVRALSGDAPENEWTDFGIVLTAGNQTTTGVVSFANGDGKVSETTLDLPQCKLGGSAGVLLGYHCDDGVGEMRYDDLRLDWE